MKPRISLFLLLICSLHTACEEPSAPPNPSPPLPNYEGYYIGTSNINDYRQTVVFYQDPATMNILDSVQVYVDTSFMFVDTIEVRKVEGDTTYLVDWRGSRANNLIYTSDEPPYGFDTKYSFQVLGSGIRGEDDFGLSMNYMTTGFGTEDSLSSSYHFEDLDSFDDYRVITLNFKATRRDPLD